MNKLTGRLGSQAVAGMLVAGLLGSGVAATKKAPDKMKMSRAHGMMVQHKMAGKSHTNGRATQVTGTVVAVSGTALTIKPVMSKNGHNKTIQVPMTAKVWLGNRPQKLGSLTVGQKATVFMNANGVVTRVVVQTKAGAGHHGAGNKSGMKMSSKMGHNTKMSTKMSGKMGH